MYEQLFHLHADLLKALAQPRRLEIIHLLRDQELSVSQIQEMLDLPQANISQHLQILRKFGVVKTKRKGKQVFYKIAHLNFIKASDLIRQILCEQHSQDKLSDMANFSMMDLVPIVTDPVCKMRVSPKTAGFAHTYHGKTYYFCASGCLKKFKSNITKYL